MPRAVSLRQMKEVSKVSPDDGDVLIYSTASGKYVPGPQGSASKSILNDVLTAKTDAQVIVARTTGDIVYV